VRKRKSYVTRAEVAQMFEVSPNTVGRWVRSGRIPSVVTPGGRRRYPVKAILRVVREFEGGIEGGGT
jgi:excisionase family DNA binding protein